MILAPGKLRHSVHEGEGLVIISEGKRADERVLFNRPAGDLGQQCAGARLIERRHTTVARLAMRFTQFSHGLHSFRTAEMQAADTSGIAQAGNRNFLMAVPAGVAHGNCVCERLRPMPEKTKARGALQLVAPQKEADMQKQRTSKSVFSPMGCIFGGVPLHKLQRLRATQAGAWRASRARSIGAASLLIHSTFAAGEQQLVK